MLLRPLRSWAAQALRREGPGSSAVGPRMLGAQRRAWPLGNACLGSISSDWHQGSQRLPISLPTLRPEPETTPSGGCGGVEGRGQPLAAIPGSSRLPVGGAVVLRPLSGSELGSPLESRKIRYPRDCRLLQSPSHS